MNPYAQVADQFSQELGRGVAYDAQNAQAAAQQPLTLFDRFMSQYQRQYQQKMQQEEMARKQQHEDTYPKMAEDRDAKDELAAKAKFAAWIGDNYKEGENDQLALILGKASGHTKEEVEAMLPRGRDEVAPQGEEMPLPQGGTFAMPQAPNDPSQITRIPGVGGGRRLLEEKAAENARRNAEAEKIRREGLEAKGNQFQQGLEAKLSEAEKRRQFDMSLTEMKIAAAEARASARGAGGGKRGGVTGDSDELSAGQLRYLNRLDQEQGTVNKNEALFASLDKWKGAANDLLKEPGLDAIIGPMDSRTPTFMPESASAEAKYKHLNALNVMSTISEMKSMSKTGATGWGAVNQRELEIMENSAAALATIQDEATFRKALKDLIANIDSVKARVSAAAARMQQHGVLSRGQSGAAAPAGGNKLQEDIAALKAAGATDAEILAALGKR